MLGCGDRRRRAVHIRGLDAGGREGTGGKAADPSVSVGSGRGAAAVALQLLGTLENPGEEDAVTPLV